jgi:SAM-dependent methyltransferase
MKRKPKGLDWSKRPLKQMLVEQRKFLWPEDTVAKLAAWMGLKPGMTAVDVGCGLGYLGYTYWPYFGKGGRYFGVDTSPQLLRNAEKAARGWAVKGKAVFYNGTAYNLPFPDRFADLMMCQTLLMHLKDPGRALAEMTRVAKPGGLVMCQEPDNLSSFLTKSYSSLPEWTVKERLFLNKISLYSHQGRVNLGRGDSNIGPQVPGMMKAVGLEGIDIRMNDKVYLIQPPYEDKLQQHWYKMTLQGLVDKTRRRYWLRRNRQEILAGGGTPEEYRRYKRMADYIEPIARRQLEAKTYSACGGSLFYVVKGRKPK